MAWSRTFDVHKIDAETGKRVYSGTVKYNNETGEVKYGGNKGGAFGNYMKTSAARTTRRQQQNQAAMRGRSSRH